MKAKIVCTYEGLEVERVLDEYLICNMKKIGADFVGGGYDFKTQIRDLEFEISISP